MTKHLKLELGQALVTMILGLMMLLVPITLQAADSGTLWLFSLDQYHPAQPSLGLIKINDVKSFDVGSGGAHNLYLKNDGTVWASGGNTAGELGIGNMTDTCNYNGCPTVQVHGENGQGYLTNVIAVSSGQGFSLALKDDNTVVAWGANAGGLLGVGSASQNVLYPTKVVGPGGSGFLTGITSISAGWDGSWGFGHSLALRASDGTVWAWGNASYGQLGDNNTHSYGTYSSYPVQVLTSSGPLTDVKSISAANGFSLALKNGGTVWSWGANSWGNLGVGTYGIDNSSSHAVQVKGVGGTGYLTGIDLISARGTHCLAFSGTPSGTFYTWGGNAYGMLCDGSTTYRNTPVVAGILPVCTGLFCGGGTVEIAAGTSISLIKNPGGQISACGRGFGNTSTSPDYSKVLVDVPVMHNVTAITAGYAAMALGPARTDTGVQIASSVNPSVSGQTVSFTANVSGSGGPPTGTVSISTDNSNYFASAPLTADDTAAYSINWLPVGNNNIYFRYNGDYNFAPSTSQPLQQVVNKIPTTTTLTSSLNPSMDNGSVTFTAPVTPSASTGTVNFYEGGNIIGSASLISGTAGITVSSLTIGIHAITAVYAGDATRAGSTSTELTQGVKSHIPLTISGTPDLTVAVENAYSFTPASNIPKSFSITKKPGWADFDSTTGILSGTPHISDTGTYSGIVISVTDGYDTVSLPPFSITVTPQGCSSITLLPASLPIGALGVPHNRTVTASGGANPYAYAITSGALPDGLTFGANGTLNGTPSKAGTYNFIVLAVDASGCAGGQAYSVTIIDFSTAPKLAAGGGHSMALKKDGTLLTWGLNNLGQLGTGDYDDRYARIQIGSDTDWVSVAAGEWFSVALKADGTLWSWGNNWYGQLGVGDSTNRIIPVQVGSDSNWVAVATGRQHALALKADGTLWSWGNNDFGQLGRVVSDDGNIPVQIGGDKDWKFVAAGGLKSMAVKTDGTLWVWGREVYNFSDSAIPLQIGSDKDWKSAAAGESHLLAVKTGGTLWAWGSNGNGQLGIGTSPEGYTYSQQTPVQVGSETDWKTVAAGSDHSMALKTDGALWTWGRNANGQLGTNDADDRPSPAKIGSDTDWAFIAGGQIHSLAMKTDGSIYAWGSNGNGRLGTGDLIDSLTPAQLTKYSANISLSNLFQTYDGTPKSISLGSIPSGLDVSVTYNGSAIPPTNAGDYNVVAVITTPNYIGSASGILTIDKATATVLLYNMDQIYTGTPRNVDVITIPPGLPVNVTYDGSSTTPTAVGSYAVIAVTLDPNYYESGMSGTLTISAAVIIKETSLYYSSIHEAYSAALDGQSIQMRAVDFTGNLDLSDNKYTKIQGGFDSTFASQTGFTTIHGKLSVSKGKVIIKNVKVW